MALKAALSKIRRSDDGIVALEFALIAPLFLVLVIGTMVFSIYFATLVAVIHGATEGARASIAGLSTTDRAQLAQARTTAIFEGYEPLLDHTRVTVNSTAGSAPGTFRVQVSYPISDFEFGWFYRLMNWATGGGGTAPTTISHSAIVMNGGY